MYVVVVNGMVETECRSFKLAEKIAEKRKGKVFRRKWKSQKMPKSSMLSYNDPKSLKREIFREIYSENNHGYHFIKKGGKHYV